MMYQETKDSKDWQLFWEDDCLCVEERMTGDEYDEHLERRLYERSNRL